MAALSSPVPGTGWGEAFPSSGSTSSTSSEVTRTPLPSRATSQAEGRSGRSTEEETFPSSASGGSVSGGHAAADREEDGGDGRRYGNGAHTGHQEEKTNVVGKMVGMLRLGGGETGARGVLPSIWGSNKGTETGGGQEQGPEGEWHPLEALSKAVRPKALGDPKRGGVNPALDLSTTFAFEEPEDMSEAIQAGGSLDQEQELYQYSRGWSPNVLHLGRQLAALEGTEAAYCTASGMAAVSATLLQLVGAGERIVASSRLYGGTFALMRNFAPRYNVEVSLVDVTDLEAVDRALQASATKVLYFEAMSNPALVIPDIEKLAALGHKHNAHVVVDNTFAPLVLSPARWGVDVVLHSLTKFINGSSDIMGGAVYGRREFVEKLGDWEHGMLILLGGVMTPQVAWQMSTRLPHLGLRMKEHSARALLFATRLQSLGVKVLYPGLPSHPNHELLKRLASPYFGYGGMLTIDLETEERASKLASCAQNDFGFGIYAVSLGYHDTLMSISGTSTAHNLTKEEQEAANISPGLLRISVGFTGQAESRWRQLHSALEAANIITKGESWAS